MQEKTNTRIKKLFVLVSDGGDGSYYTRYTFNEKWIKEQEEKHKNGELEYGSAGYDCDGFHYQTLTVPDECTLDSLGIGWDCSNN